MIHHRYIQQSIIRHGIWRLTITSRIAYTHRHHSASDDIRVDLDMHLVVETLEDHQNKREDERQRSGTEDMMGLATQIHNRSNESDVHTVEEIAQALLPFLVGVSDTSQVYLSHPAFLKPGHRLLYVTVIESPEAGKIIHQAIRNHSQRHFIALGSIHLHQAIDGIIERRISANNHYRLIAIIDKHLHQSLNALLVFALHEVVIHALLPEHLFYLFPALGTAPTATGTIQESPLISFTAMILT